VQDLRRYLRPTLDQLRSGHNIGDKQVAIDFPNSPVDQELFLAGNGISYRWNSLPAPGVWSAEAGPPGATKLSDLTDAQIINPIDGEMMVYDLISTEYVNQTMYFPANGFIIQPNPRKYTALYRFVHPHVVEDLAVVAEVSSGTVTGLIRAAAGGDTAITGLMGVSLSTTDAVYVATANRNVAAGDSLIFEIVSGASLVGVAYCFKCRRVYS